MQKIDVQIGTWKMTYVLAVTSAPEAFDGYGTFTVREIGPNEFKPADTDRMIMIQTDMVDWQTARNSSGLYPTFTDPKDCEYLDDYYVTIACNIMAEKMMKGKVDK